MQSELPPLCPLPLLVSASQSQMSSQPLLGEDYTSLWEEREFVRCKYSEYTPILKTLIRFSIYREPHALGETPDFLDHREALLLLPQPAIDWSRNLVSENSLPGMQLVLFANTRWKIGITQDG